jgi:hypothetical protein
MSLTLPELACVIAIGVAAIQLPRGASVPVRTSRAPAPEVFAQRGPVLPVRDAQRPAAPTRAVDATKEGKPQ